MGECPDPQPPLRITAVGVTQLSPVQDGVINPEPPQTPKTQEQRAGPLQMGPLRPLQ